MTTSIFLGRGPPVGGDRYHNADGYGAPRIQEDYNQPYYQESYGTYGRQRPRGGGYDNRQRGPPQRDQYGYEQYGDGAGSRVDDRVSSVDTTDGNDAAGKSGIKLQTSNVPMLRQNLAFYGTLFLGSHLGRP